MQSTNTAGPTGLAPKSLEELREAVADAASQPRLLEVVGQGTKRGFGRPVEANAVLSTKALAGVDLYEPEELVMSAGAGTPLATIEAMLAERQQELAFEPLDLGAVLGGEPGGGTIGGVFACNLSGPRRLKVGAARDHLLGVQCVTGRGEAIKTGGRVVKNVTGYDLCKLLTGSHGTLAVMSRVTFKVMPRAESSATLLLVGSDERLLLGRLREAMKTSNDVSGAALLPALAAGRSAIRSVAHAGRPMAAMRLEGPPPSVAARLEALSGVLGGQGLELQPLDDADTSLLWREIRDLRLMAPRRALWRLSLPPTAAEELSGWIAELAQERLYDWAGGLVWIAPRAAWAEAHETIRRAIEGRGGHATLVRADEDLRAMVPVFQPQPAPLAALTRRVKESFDPLRILNRGRMYPDI
jgi:glycolate oxidase FAD binding subunit